MPQRNFKGRISITGGIMIEHAKNEDIQRFLDGQVSAEDSAKIKSHLNICQQCRREYQSYTIILNALKHEPESDFSAQFTDRILYQIKSSARIAWYRRSPDILLAISGILISIIISIFFISSEAILNLISTIDRIIPERIILNIGSHNWLPSHIMYPYLLTGIIILLIIIFIEQAILKKRGLIYFV